MARIIGNGLNTSFWNVKWRGEGSFRSKYPRLFSISNQKESMVGELGVVEGSSTEWNFEWRQELFAWEEQLLVSLMEDLVSRRIGGGGV